MATATDNRPKVSRAWRRLLCSLPGYDPFAQAELVGAWFEPELAQHYIDFIEQCCTHIEGALAGQPFLLERWEKAVVANLFGWQMIDEQGRQVRRYRVGFIFVPRKNGKTPLVAAIANAVLFVDEELGQQDYCSATDTEQATILFRQMEGMIENEPEMECRVTTYATRRRILHHGKKSYMQVLSGEAKGKHGRNPHFIAVDELHEQDKRDLVDTLRTSFASLNRAQPLLLYATTSDFDRPSICNEEHDYACRVRDNPGDPSLPGCDPRYLPVIYEPKRDDQGKMLRDWWDEKLWREVNPNLGVSVSLEYLRGECRKARENPAYENTFKRLHLNIRTEQATRIIPMAAWDACREDIDMDRLEGRLCYGALDIGATSDFCAFDLLFPHDDGEKIELHQDPDDPESEMTVFVRRSYTKKSWFWLPESPRKRDSRMQALIDVWTRQGLVKRTPGNVTDYAQIAADIVSITTPYALSHIAVDQGFQGMQITQDLQRHFGEDRIIAFRQGILSMAAPFRELLELIMMRRLHHDGNPIARWMASNVAAEERGGLIKPSKDKSPEKIDDITAATMALGIAMTEQPPEKSVYETRGIRSI